MSARHIVLCASRNPVGWFNVSAANLQRWRAAVARVRAGTGRGRVIFVGDSTTAGAGAGSGGTLNENGCFPNSFPNQLATLLGAQMPVSAKSFWGDQLNAVTYAVYDTRVTQGVGWTASAPFFGGRFLSFTAGSGATAMHFTPAGQIDNFEVWYSRAGGLGSFTTAIDGGAVLHTVNTLGAAGLLKQAETVARGSHIIDIASINTGGLFIGGVLAWDSTVPAIDVIQAGWVGGLVANYSTTGTPTSALNVLTALAPDLTVIDLTINDSNGATALATYQAGMQAIISAAQTSGDVLLMVGPPSSSTQAVDGTLDQYIGVLRGLALANNCGILDMKARWKSWAAINPTLPYYDTLHPTTPGYADIAAALLPILKA